jgi:hypothetical protein
MLDTLGIATSMLDRENERLQKAYRKFGREVPIGMPINLLECREQPRGLDKITGSYPSAKVIRKAIKEFVGPLWRGERFLWKPRYVASLIVHPQLPCWLK